MPDPAVTIIETLPGIVVVRVQPETIDEASLAALRVETAAAGAAAPNHLVALDLSRVSFLPSLILGGLIQLAQVFKSRKQRLVLVGLQSSVRETLLVTRLDRVFEIQHDLAALTLRVG